MAVRIPSWSSLHKTEIDITAARHLRPSVIKYVGPIMRQQLANGGILTLQHLMTRMFRNTIDNNRQWLQHLLRNPRRRRCVGRVSANGNKFETNTFNLFAYNALLTYVRAQANRVQKRHIPNCHPFRTRAYAYPGRCRP